MTTADVDDATASTVRFYAARYETRGGEPWHAHDGWHQLVHAARGALTVHAAGAVWVVPPSRAIWIPSGIRHRFTASTRSTLETIYLDARITLDADPVDALRVVEVGPLARALIEEIAGRCPCRTDVATNRRLVEVLLEQLRERPAPSTQLRDPVDRRALDAARLIRRDPARSIGSVAAEVGASRRTLERAFLAETGLPLGRWQHRARMLRALELLADRSNVTETALTVGYSTTSAFVASFRRDFGETPSRCFR